MSRFLTILAIAALATLAHAQDGHIVLTGANPDPSVASRLPPRPSPAAQCAASFPERLADARRAIAELEQGLKAYREAMPVVDWFNAHCRFLTELERTVRKLDDPNSFVCNTKKGRPKNLTAELVMSFQVEPALEQHTMTENVACENYDQAERISLVFGALTPRQKLDVLCYDNPSPACASVRVKVVP